MHSNYLKTDGFDGPNGTGDDFVAGGRVSTPPPLSLRLRVCWPAALQGCRGRRGGPGLNHPLVGQTKRASDQTLYPSLPSPLLLYYCSTSTTL